MNTPGNRHKPILEAVKEKLPALLVVGFVVAGAVVIFLSGGRDHGAAARTEVRLPALSQQGQRGASLFTESCAHCHGENAAGGSGGPPLIHGIYNPGHHADEAFRRAVRLGVRQHHWRFGNMPAQPQISAVQIEDIIRFIREVQVANGIAYKRH
jgi:mono/diheme cytochrome c family protein